jgi:hypothetical protein
MDLALSLARSLARMLSVARHEKLLRHSTLIPITSPPKESAGNQHDLWLLKAMTISEKCSGDATLWKLNSCRRCNRG